MATDLETGIETGEPGLARPNVKIVGMHIRGLKSIESLDLPEDGLGWNGIVPDTIMIGGINGSGKTTLLEFIAAAFDHYGQYQHRTMEAANAWVDIQLTIPDLESVTYRFIIGDKQFIDSNEKVENWFGFEVDHQMNPFKYQPKFHDKMKSELYGHFLRSGRQINNELPGVVFFPSEGRTLIIPEVKFKTPGKLIPSSDFIHRWQKPKEWQDSLIARLYGLRWEDLNAKEEGRPQEATHFQSYQLAFDQFFEGRKRLKWDHGELVVETKDKNVHDLANLSSGEKQVILFMSELLYRWRPGSIILIDEPELHLHESYQTKLWEALLRCQKVRGGQVILATQSDHLFGLSGLGTRVILGGRAR